MKNNNNNNSKVTFAITSDALTLLIDGKPFHFARTNKFFGKLINAIRAKDWVAVRELADTATTIKNYMCGKVNVADGVVTYNGEPVHNLVADKILSFISQDLPHEPLVKFLENLMLSTSKRVVDELYRFLETNKMPISDDGAFYAWKRIRSDNNKDFYTNTLDYSVGNVVEMPRNQVCDDKEQTCQSGLHFSSRGYLQHYHNGEGKIVIVKVFPQDVISIPIDYDNTKGRCCKMTVIADEVEGFENEILVTSGAKTTVNSTGQKVKRDSKGRFCR